MEVRAYAKINLTLEVLGRRPDGYHEVRTILQTIDLADVLSFTSSPRLEMECSAPGLDGEDNLVWKAVLALRAATSCDRGARIRLEKHIPIGMGYGGGSSDAAATLKALNVLWSINMDDTDLQSIGSSLGSDVPFFLTGGTSLGEGRGELLTDLPPMPQRWMVLLCPPSRFTGHDGALGRKTTMMYSMLTQEHYTDGSFTHRLADAIVGGRISDELLFNVFESLAPLAYEGFERARLSFLDAGAQGVNLSGAGPSLYAFVSGEAEGERVSKSLKSEGLEAYCVSTCSYAFRAVDGGSS